VGGELRGEAWEWLEEAAVVEEQWLHDLFCSVFPGESEGERDREERAREIENERERERREGAWLLQDERARCGGEHASECEGHAVHVPYDRSCTMPFLKMFQQPSP